MRQIKAFRFFKKAASQDWEDINATDSAIQLAHLHRVDISTVTGTGVDGRILTKDVKNAIKEINAYEAVEIQKLIELHNIDIYVVTGTGYEGAVTLEDVQSYVEGFLATGEEE